MNTDSVQIQPAPTPLPTPLPTPTPPYPTSSSWVAKHHFALCCTSAAASLSQHSVRMNEKSFQPRTDDAHQQDSSPTSVHSLFSFIWPKWQSSVAFCVHDKRRSVVFHYNEACVCVCVCVCVCAARILYLTGYVDFSASSEFIWVRVKLAVNIHSAQLSERLDERIFVLYVYKKMFHSFCSLNQLIWFPVYIASLFSLVRSCLRPGWPAQVHHHRCEHTGCQKRCQKMLNTMFFLINGIHNTRLRWLDSLF